MLTNSSALDESQPLRILVLSVRGFRFQVANCCIYEFEDLLCGLESADLYVPSREFNLANKVYRATKYLSRSDRFCSQIVPFPRQLTLNQKYDLLFAVFDNPWQMHLLETIQGWQDKFRHRACYIAEMWEPDLHNWRLLQEPFGNFDRIFLGVTNCVAGLQQKIKRPVSYIPPAVDTLRFSPYPNPPQRSIDVCYVGRRSPLIHESLLELTQERDFLYYYDTVKKQQLEIENPQEHRHLLANLFKRSRYNITNYAKFNSQQETGGTQEIGYRFFEGAAAGTVMIGMPPAGDAFSRYFDWEEPIVKVDFSGRDVVEAIAELDAQPKRLENIRRRNVANSLLKHDWVYRWHDILNAFDLQPSQATRERERYLKQLAEKILTPSYSMIL
jgi:hypothetical protein